MVTSDPEFIEAMSRIPGEEGPNYIVVLGTNKITGVVDLIAQEKVVPPDPQE